MPGHISNRRSAASLLSAFRLGKLPRNNEAARFPKKSDLLCQPSEPGKRCVLNNSHKANNTEKKEKMCVVTDHSVDPSDTSSAMAFVASDGLRNAQR